MRLSLATGANEYHGAGTPLSTSLCPLGLLARYWYTIIRRAGVTLQNCAAYIKYHLRQRGKSLNKGRLKPRVVESIPRQALYPTFRV